MRRVVLLNPNTSAATTARMCAIARDGAGDLVVTGRTAARGAPVITDEAGLAVAAGEVARMAGELAGREVDGVVVAAFGDPGLRAARAALAVPVVGIAEAALAEAAAGGRRFAIATTTPDLLAALHRRVEECGVAAAFAGVFLTRSGVVAMDDPDRLVGELYDACGRAVADGAEAVVIGGGPLATAARALRPLVAVTLVEPIPAAMGALLAWTGRPPGATSGA